MTTNDIDRILTKLEPCSYDVYFNLLFDAIYEATGLKEQDITSSSREYRFVVLRTFFSYLCRRKNIPYQLIAKRLNRNHSSVINYINNYDSYYKFDTFFKDMVDSCSKEFYRLQRQQYELT